MVSAQLEELKRLLSLATPGPWDSCLTAHEPSSGFDGGEIMLWSEALDEDGTLRVIEDGVLVGRPEDLDLIAKGVSALPALIAEVETQAERIKFLERALDQFGGIVGAFRRLERLSITEDQLLACIKSQPDLADWYAEKGGRIQLEERAALREKEAKESK
jgi:hypothetical protein